MHFIFIYLFTISVWFKYYLKLVKKLIQIMKEIPNLKSFIK